MRLCLHGCRYKRLWETSLRGSLTSSTLKGWHNTSTLMYLTYVTLVIHLLVCTRPLFFVGMKVFKEFEICDVLDIEETVLASWLKLMERHYHQQNTYHNSTHAADVLQATTYFVNNLQDYLVSQGVSVTVWSVYNYFIVDHGACRRCWNGLR